ncbi:MAG: Stk1 family PASTA domain-containing Ser/Thr kinase [Coprobacillus sp.]|nr:Stk1 family PASTA domain-containing Ser/Thr kinase [Coprobacillus sp.]
MNLIGRMLANRYEILEKIGNGGMATVYKAKCHVLNRFVAIKILKEEFITDIEFIKRFKSEAQTAASLTHPNIVSIYDVGNEGDVYYIVMELIQGKTLKEIIVEDGKLSWKWSVNIAIQIASALETAHKNSLIHRDIKPHNIIITEDGMAKVTDFGIAKAVSNSTITAFGTTIGSVHYFSPEHAKGGATDAKSDIYSLGIVMYEMLTGRVPFDADTPVSVALMQVQEEPIEPKKLNPQIPISVNNIILKAMQKDPMDRYQNATEMLIDLSTALKRPDENFVKINKKFDTLQTQKLSTLYDIDSKVISDEEDFEEPRKSKNPKKKRGVIGFFKDHVIVSLVLVAIILFSLAFGGTMLFMNAKPKDVQIPNLVKNEQGERLTEQQAKARYDNTDFKKKNELKIEYVEDDAGAGEVVEPGKVIKQDPPYRANYKIKDKDQITIYVKKAREAKTLKMIDLTGKTKEETEAALKALGYVGTIKYEEENSETLKEGLIIKQSILKDIEFKDDVELVITVSAGSSKVDVPNTLGKDRAAAVTMLESAGFKVEVEETEDSNKTDGIVLKQDITGKADPGATIKLTVNKVQKTSSVVVTVDLSKYVSAPVQPEPTDDETENTTKPVKTARVSIKVDDSTTYGGESYDVTTKPQITIYGKGYKSVTLIIDGSAKISKDVNFGVDTTLAFP